MQKINVEDYEEQRKRRNTSRLEEDDRIFEQFPQEGARIVPESDARLVEVQRQAEDERAHNLNQVQMREAEIQRLRRVMQQADRKGYESQNAASLAAGQLELAQLMNLGALRRAATSPAQLVGRSRLPTNASPLRPIELRSPMQPGAEGP